jgi:hypothetical protein
VLLAGAERTLGAGPDGRLADQQAHDRVVIDVSYREGVPIKKVEDIVIAFY